MFSNADCTPRFRKSEPAFYVEVKYSVGLNAGDFLSILSTATGFLAKAENPEIRKRGMNFRLSSGYSIYLDSVLRPESGYKIGLEEIFKQKLLEDGRLESPGDFGKYRKKNYEFLLSSTGVEFFLGESEKISSLSVSYGELEKYINKDIFSEP